MHLLALDMAGLKITQHALVGGGGGGLQLINRVCSVALIKSVINYTMDIKKRNSTSAFTNLKFANLHACSIAMDKKDL